MSTHIELLFDPVVPESDAVQFLRKRLPEIEPSDTYQQDFVRVSDVEYYFTVGKLPYQRHRRFLMQFCRDRLPTTPVVIIFDVSGDDEDERLVIRWDGNGFVFDFCCT